jgi:hypothetical protein
LLSNKPPWQIPSPPIPPQLHGSQPGKDWQIDFTHMPINLGNVQPDNAPGFMTTSSSPWGQAVPVKWPKTSLAPNFAPFQQEVARTDSVPLYQRVWDVWPLGSHPMVIRDSAHFPLHPLLPFMITMATPAGRQWVLTHITPSSSPPNLDLS